VDAILQAAARILVRDGYDHTSTNRVAEEAGVSVGSLYQYFPSKEALVAALHERHTTRIAQVFDRKLSQVEGAPMPVVVREVVEAVFAAHRVSARLHKVLHEQMPRVGQLAKLADLQSFATARIEAVLGRYEQQIAATDLRLTAFILVQTVEALSHAALSHPRYLANDDYLNQIVELITRYLQPRSGGDCKA
jgi:AcrR family transcriptional regulator